MLFLRPPTPRDPPSVSAARDTFRPRRPPRQSDSPHPLPALMSRFPRYARVLILGLFVSLGSLLGAAPVRMEKLDRGLVAIRTGSTQVYLGWRMLGTDPDDVSFNLYRSIGGASATKLNASPLTLTTDYRDSPGSGALASGVAYHVRPIIDGVEQAASETFTLPPDAATQPFLSVPIEAPAGGTTPDGVAYTYSANDLAPADLDGDGRLDLVLKWEPSNAKDNSQSGHTGNVFMDGYTLAGARLWRIDLGRNIRAGAHYTQFIAYDLDGDGRAELACKTAPGTRDGAGDAVLLPGDSADADYRNASGYLLDGPEYLTVFDGLTGRALATTAYLPGRGSVSSWGDSYGNRVDRFLAGVAYLDGERPSLIMARGYYTRTVVAAWDWRDRALTRRWTFDSAAAPSSNLAYAGQGNHQLSVADVDADGRQEIIYGSMTLDDDGTGLYSTGLGHGDALHVSDFDPARPGLEVFAIHEDMGSSGNRGATFRDAATGEIIWSSAATGDTGRGIIMDIDPDLPGAEAWATNDGNIYAASGAVAGGKPSNFFHNFAVWWDADPLREMLDGTTVSDVNPATYGRTNLLTAWTYGATSNNGTKSTPALSGDILGDWREEIVWRNTDSTALLIFTPTGSATNRLRTFLHDPQYRVALAWQNVGYNQPPHPGFFVGAGMAAPPMPNITTEPVAQPRLPAAIRWTGAESAAWDLASTNFATVADGTPTSFVAGDDVTIDDSSSTPVITLGAALAPASLRIDSALARTLSGAGSLGGSASLTKTGAGSLTLGTANSHAGGTVLQAGSIILGNASALGTGAVTLRGGLWATGTLTPANAIVVDGAATISGGSPGGTHGIKAVSGDGVLTLEATNVFDLEGSLAAYDGRLVFTGTGSFRFFGSTGSASAEFDLGTRSLNARSGSAFALGSLTGSAGSFLSGSSGGGNNAAVTYTIGARGTDTTFAGAIINGNAATSIVKTGSGRLLLTGISTHTGTTRVAQGALLVAGELGGTAVTVEAGATFGGGGSLGGSLTLADGARLALGPTGASLRGPAVAGAVNINGIVTVTATDLGGAPAPGSYPLLDYGSLVGAPGFVWEAPTGSPLTATFDSSVPGRIQIIITDPRPAFELWTEARFGVGAADDIAGALADPEGDGRSNLLEYALGGDPLAADPVDGPVLGVESGRLTLSFDRTADPDLVYEVEAADALSAEGWGVIWTSSGEANVAGPVTVTDTVELNGRPSRFLRLRVR